MSAILNLAVGPIRLAALAAAAGAGALAVLALGGAFSRWLDVLTHFAPLYALVCLAAILLRLATGLDGGRLTYAVAAAGLAAALALIAPDALAALKQRPAAPAGETLKLIQFNLWNENRDPEAAARWLAAQDADVVVLEEANDVAARVPHLLKAAYPYQTTCAPPWPCSTRILTRRPPSAFAGLQGAVSPYRLSAAWVTLGEGDKAFTVAGTHYTWPVPPGPQQSQMRRMRQALAGFDPSSLILAGDMNSTPWSFALRRQDRALGLVRRTHGLFSWPAAPFAHGRLRSPLPFLAIDQVYAGRTWRTVSVTRGPYLGSDHFPVVVVLT
ncbi:MAG TPA: endonuclease/exonuclease/phosphatase family protein, partial [Caulobacteraceae bacterium]|nr:endonuclease/exonuclease/phosphatase family protein [Caulobacteraceae bacterium]